MTRIQKIIIAASIVLSAGIIGFALMVSRQADMVARKSQTAQGGSAAAAASPRTVSQAELAAATGKDGRDCLVAVDGTVYKIDDFSLWQNGQHKGSDGSAYCGADMSAVIDKAPHGRKNLELLVKIGPLAV